MAEIRLAPTALADLQAIKEYIENDLSNPAAAQNVVKRIIQDYTRLGDAPFIGARLSSKIAIETDFRYLVSGNYIIFYQVNEEFVSVYRILYGRRDYIKIIFGDVCGGDEAN